MIVYHPVKMESKSQICLQSGGDIRHITQQTTHCPGPSRFNHMEQEKATSNYLENHIHNFFYHDPCIRGAIYGKATGILQYVAHILTSISEDF